MNKLIFRAWTVIVFIGFILVFWVPVFLGLAKMPWRYIAYEYKEYIAAIKVVMKAFIEGKKQK